MKNSVRLICLYFFIISFIGCNQSMHATDDRLCDAPRNEVTLEDLIDCCKKHELRNIYPGMDTTLFFVSFNIFSQNDTNKLWVMGDFANPIFLHDCSHMDNFLGCFKIRDTYCFFYKCLYSNLMDVREAPSISSFFLEDWHLRTPSENPEFFPVDISGTIRDPYVFEYQIDSIGNYSLLRKGHW